MSEEKRDAGSVWRSQPEEKAPVKLDPSLSRRAGQLYASTRSEILMSIGAALLFGGVLVLRFGQAREGVPLFGLAVVAAWAAVSMILFRRRIWRPAGPAADDLAATGREHYRKELARRRDHLRNAWIWHGPLFLAVAIFLVTFGGSAFPGPDRMRNVLPLVLVLVVWTALGIRRRWRQAAELQREIDSIDQL